MTIDPAEVAPTGRWAGVVEWKLYPEFIAALVRRKVLHLTRKKTFDLVFADSGSLIDSRLLKSLRARAGHLVNFNHDDPYGSRDWVRFRVYRKAVSAYDLVAVVRQPNVAEALTWRARRVLLTYRTADIVGHAPIELSDAERQQWASDVLFVGTWMKDRARFLLELADRGVTPAIYGNSWEKAPEWGDLRRLWRGPALEGRDYRCAIRAAKVCLGFLSRDNRDLHTTRSLEIPRMGGLFCAERTPEHQMLYDDGREALLWSSVEECANLCKDILADSGLRESVALAGHQRALREGHTNDRLIEEIAAALDQPIDQRVIRSGAWPAVTPA